jgi:3-deoxy-manno-octulosonate cytidylyltransferase (CMP-KDO synthetase)
MARVKIMKKLTAIIIPARYASTRLPGKPLAMLAGKTMLQRVVEIAKTVAHDQPNISVIVATDDQRVAQHCQTIGVDYIHTDPSCASGTDRVAYAVQQLPYQPNLILNLQGDAPLTPPDFLVTMIEGFYQHPCDMVTPVTQLTWDELDQLRLEKCSTPFSGTCAVFHQHTGQALWFSKNIIPAMRNEEALRRQGSHSPIYRHIGMYGYSPEMLKKYGTLPLGYFEQLEGLEQLRMLEHGYKIRCVPVDYRGRPNMSGVDSPADLAKAEALIRAAQEII